MNPSDEALRAEFAKIDRQDDAALRQWFTSHPYCSSNDHAQIAGVSVFTIQRWKRRVGCGTGRKTFKCISPRFPVTTVLQTPIPDDWRTNIEWLQQTVDRHGLRQLAKLVNKDRATLRKRIRRLGIKIRNLSVATKSNNPCCTHAWCYEHYVVRKLSQRQCAKLANITQQNFGQWLNRFKIPVRNISAAHAAHRGLALMERWEKKFINELQQQPIVSKIRVRTNYYHVHFRDYFYDNYSIKPYPNRKRPHTYFELDPTNCRIEKIPLVYPEYGVDVDGKALYPAHIALSRADLAQASIVEQRLALHEYTRQIVTRGWIWPAFPEAIVQADFEQVCASAIATYEMNGGFTSRMGYAQPGRKVLMQFFDFSRYWSYLRRPRLAVRFASILLAKTTIDFNFYNLLTTVTRNPTWMRTPTTPIPNPAVYTAIFRKLGFQGTLLDVAVGLGTRAVACAAAGLRYTSADPAINPALERGFEQFSGLIYEPYTGQKVDVAIYDEGFIAPDMTKIMPYLDKAKTLLVFVPAKNRDEVLKYKPKEAIRFKTNINITNYLFIW